MKIKRRDRKGEARDREEMAKEKKKIFSAGVKEKTFSFYTMIKKGLWEGKRSTFPH